MKYLLALGLCINSLSPMDRGNSGVVHYFVGMQDQTDGGSNRLALNPRFKDIGTPICADRVKKIRGYFKIKDAEQLFCKWLGVKRLEDLSPEALPAESKIKEIVRQADKEMLRGYFHNYKGAEQLFCKWIEVKQLEDLSSEALPAESKIKEMVQRAYVEMIRDYCHHFKPAEQSICRWLGIERLEDLTWGALPAERDIKEMARRYELSAMITLAWDAKQEKEEQRRKKGATQAPSKDCLEGEDLRPILKQIITNQYHHPGTIEYERYLSFIPELAHFYTTRSSFEGLSEKEKINKLKELSWPQLKGRLDGLIAGKNLQQWLGNEVTGLTAFGFPPDETSYPELGLGDIGSNGRFKKEVCKQ